MWFLNNIIGIVSIIVSGFIAYHLYFLSKRINLKDKLLHKENIKEKVENLLIKTRKEGSSKIELINIKKFENYYPKDNKLNKDGYTYLAAYLKAIRFDGVEFLFRDLTKDVYKKNDKLTFEKQEGSTLEDYQAVGAGLIPYEWIEYIDENGDEFSYRPQFFTLFNSENKDPYKYITYYKKNDKYREGNDPVDFQWTRIEID